VAIVAGGAWLGETPAAWMRPVIWPSTVAVSTRSRIDEREEMSTVVVPGL
jgi:hypothetical protein